MKIKYVSIALAALVASTAPAQAALTVYTSLAAFTAATSAPGTDTYTGFSITGSTPSPITRTAGAYTYTATASTSTFFGAGTVGNPWLSTNLATDSVLFNGFSPSVNAIGGNFFGSDINGLFLAGGVTLVATDSLGATSTQTITGATVGSFLGFVSTGNITGLTLSAVQGAAPLWPTVDNLTLARRPAVGAVPESSTWLMMIAGFGIVGGAMRRRTTVRIAQAL
jgi:hypothetical protein